jgi:tetratricopeptide (TPR) repeat protein
LGKTYDQMGNRKAAIENYRLALKHDEHFAYARYNLGAALLDGGDARGAIAELEKITQQLHCPAGVHFLLGRAYQIGGFSSKAEEEVQIARDLSSTDKATSHSSP